MKTQNPKFLILLICFLAVSFNAVANDTIRFNVKVTHTKFPFLTEIIVADGEQFIVDFGDGSGNKVFEGKDRWQEIRYFYDVEKDYTVTITAKSEDCIITHLWIYSISNSYYITNLDVSKCTSLQGLYCLNQKLTTLDLSNNTALITLNCFSNQLINLDLSNNYYLCALDCSHNLLSSLDLSSNNELVSFECTDNQLSNLILSNNNKINIFDCHNNRLRLSDLYAIYLTINPKWGDFIRFGEQLLTSHTIEVYEQIDYSLEKEFFEIATIFTIKKDSLSIPENDYAINGGFITFHTKGKYQVKMTNDAVSSFCYGNNAAKVIAEINVGNVNVPITKEEIDIKVYPNPTTGVLRVESAECQITKIEFFDIFGGKQKAESRSQNEIDISNLTIGAYFVEISTDYGVVVKKIVKQ